MSASEWLFSLLIKCELFTLPSEFNGYNFNVGGKPTFIEVAKCDTSTNITCGRNQLHTQKH